MLKIEAHDSDTVIKMSLRLTLEENTRGDFLVATWVG